MGNCYTIIILLTISSSWLKSVIRKLLFKCHGHFTFSDQTLRSSIWALRGVHTFSMYSQGIRMMLKNRHSSSYVRSYYFIHTAFNAKMDKWSWRKKQERKSKARKIEKYAKKLSSVEQDLDPDLYRQVMDYLRQVQNFSIIGNQNLDSETVASDIKLLTFTLASQRIQLITAGTKMACSTLYVHDEALYTQVQMYWLYWLYGKGSKRLYGKCYIKVNQVFYLAN